VTASPVAEGRESDPGPHGPPGSTPVGVSPTDWPVWRVWLGTTVWLLLAGLARSAIPGVNEPHYWTKARHFWQPDWLPRDLFLASENAHAGFYWSVGWLAAVCPLPLAVVLGRILGAATLALGFTTLARSWGLGGRQTVAGLAVWLMLSAPVGLSGEWVIGGVESKIFAWGLLLAGSGAVWQNRPLLAAASLGAATSLHPLVGGWGSLALFAVALGEQILGSLGPGEGGGLGDNSGNRATELAQTSGAAGRTPPPLADPPVTCAGQRSDRQHGLAPIRRTGWAARGAVHPPRGWVGWWRVAGVFAVMATPGLLPVVGMLWRSPSAEVAREATAIQVYERLAHHLLPDRFSLGQIAVTGGLWCLTLGGVSVGLRGRSRNWAWGLWLVVSGLTVAGWLCNLFPWRAEVLRFYPFRLIDGLAPITAALAAVMLWRRVTQPASDNTGSVQNGSAGPDGERGRPTGRRPGNTGFTTTGLGWGLVAGCVVATAVWPFPDRVRPAWRPENRQAWLEACDWVARETPPDSLWLTPRYSFGFKWWAGRAEWVVWKDCPQDAASLVEWKRRLDVISGWRTRHHDSGFDAAAIRELADLTGLEYVLAWNDDPYEIPPLFRNAAFSVYRLGGPVDTPESATRR